MEFVGLIFGCPQVECKTGCPQVESKTDCPFSECRKMTFCDRLGWWKSLTDDAKKVITNYHLECSKKNDIKKR